VVRRVMGTTRSYACTIQARLSRLGSNVRRTSRGVVRGRSRRATMASLLPWRGLLRGPCGVQGCPEKPVPRAGAQLGAWNAGRELYQHVGNFVGSVVSPVLANLAFEGLERCLQQAYPQTGRGRHAKSNLVR
jgi:hypothetical protein